VHDLCFWSVGDGKYSLILQSLVHSFRQVGMEEDFYALSDRPINGAITHPIAKFPKGRHYLFKYNFLVEVMQKLNYRYFVYLDADNFFVRKPTTILTLAQGVPFHAFLESDCTSPLVKRKLWIKLPVYEYIRLMRDKGVKSEKIYNVNGGFFIVDKSAIIDLYKVMVDFWNYAIINRHFISDEPALAYAMHMLTGVQEHRLLRNNLDTWATDWTGVFKQCLPYEKQWQFVDYMTNEHFPANPAIVHGLQSKNAMVQLALDLRTKDDKV
jgi:hypothetical protein